VVPGSIPHGFLLNFAGGVSGARAADDEDLMAKKRVLKKRAAPAPKKRRAGPAATPKRKVAFKSAAAGSKPRKSAPQRAAKTGRKGAAHDTATSALLEALETSPIGASISRVSDGVVLYANAAVERFFGLPRGRAAGLRTADFFTDPLERAQLIGMVRQTGGVTRYALPTRTSEGKARTSLISNRLIRFGGVPAIITWVEDQTDVEQKENAIETTVRHVELVNRIAAIANRSISFYDALRQGAEELGLFLNWPIRLVYRRAQDRNERLEISTFAMSGAFFADQAVKSVLLGKSFARNEDLPGRVLADRAAIWIEDVTRDRALPRFAQIQSVRSALAIPVKANDQVVAVLEFLNPLPAERNNLLMATFEHIAAELGRVYVRDQLSATLEKARAEAQASTRAKGDFLAAITHDVLAPLHAMVERVTRSMDAPQDGALQAVKDCGENLIKVIDDILELSKIESGNLEVHLGDMSVKRVVKDVVASLESTGEREGIRLVVDVDPKIPAVVRGDAGYVRQILVNLIRNAVRFSTDGEIVVKAQHVDAVRGLVRISVKPQGESAGNDAGMRLMEAFAESESTAGRRTLGATGVGLAISRRLTALMGGELGIHRVPGKGAEIHCTLPLVQAGQKQYGEVGTSRR